MPRTLNIDQRIEGGGELSEADISIASFFSEECFQFVGK